MSTDVGVQVSSLAPQRRSKVRFAPALSISRGIESTIRSAPLLLLFQIEAAALGSDLVFLFEGLKSNITPGPHGSKVRFDAVSFIWMKIKAADCNMQSAAFHSRRIF